ncbi:MAG: extracellular solute-binding protein [Oscillospiraceae bacterium]|nr:extracellular solute-binding protein [Oscillospiraceae bacterium]
MKKILLAIALVLSLVSASCADGGGGTVFEDENKPLEDLGAAEEPETALDAVSVLASLPEADFGGYEFKFWTSNRPNQTLEIRQAPEEEETGEPINDALYKRDRLIEDKYNIKIAYTILDDVGDMTNKTQKSVASGDNSFDIVIGDFQNVTRGLAQTGSIYDFNLIPNVDMSKPWWSKYASRDMTINGKFYFPTGDITPRFTLSPYLMMFNKQLFMDYGLEYPYQKALDGNWTLDALAEIIKDKGRDLDGDGKHEMGDFYGMITEGMTAVCFYRGFGQNIISIENGYPKITLGTPKSYEVIDKLADLFAGNDWYVDPQYRSYEEGPPFREGRTLILTQTTGNLSLFRDMEYDFGILPMPKLDAGQESYYSYCNPWGAVAVAVPKTNENIERTGTLIEAFAAAGKYTSTPAQYEVTLKTKFTRDEYSEKMLDIICENASYDFGPIYNWGGCFDIILASVYKGDPIVSAFEKIQDKMESELQKTIDAFSQIED